MATTARLPAPTDDVERAEHDLATHGICAVTGVLTGEARQSVRDDLYHAGAQDRARGREQRFGLDVEHDDTNQRVWNVLSRSPVFADLAEHQVALRLLRSVLGCRCRLLDNLSANITGPGGGEMVLHADQIFVPTPWPTEPQGANAAWCVDDFTADNGATCFVPGSHLTHRPPGSDDDVVAVPMEAPAGTVVVFESRLWHRTGFNRTSDERRAGIFGWYTRPICRAQENWFLSLDPSVWRNAAGDLGGRHTGFPGAPAGGFRHLGVIRPGFRDDSRPGTIPAQKAGGARNHLLGDGTRTRCTRTNNAGPMIIETGCTS